MLQITAVAKATAGTTITFLSSFNRRYTLYASADLAGGGWLPVSGATDVPGTGRAQTLRDPAPGPYRFYRVGVSVP